MFNRIRVVTMLMMVLGVFALLQLVSGGLLFLHCSRISKVLLFLTIFDSSKVNSPQHGI